MIRVLEVEYPELITLAEEDQMQSKPSPRLENCELNSGGHNVGYSRGLPYGDDCQIVKIAADGFFEIELNGQTRFFWNHNPRYWSSRISADSIAKISINNSTANQSARVFLSSSQDVPWKSWQVIPLADSPSPCGVYVRPSADSEPLAPVEPDQLELYPEDPLSIQIFVENLQPAFEFDDDGYSAYGWEVDGQWFVRVIGPEGFFDSTFHIEWSDESDAREIAQKTIDDNKR